MTPEQKGTRWTTFLRTTYHTADRVRSLHVIHCGDPENDSGSTDISLHDGGGADFHPDPSNIGDEALSRRANNKRTPGMDPGCTNRNAPRQYYLPSHVEPILSPLGIR